MPGSRGTQGAKGTPGGAPGSHKKQAIAVQQSFIGKSLHQGEYVIEASIGRGGMGQVFLASHRTLDVPVAIKQARADQPLPESVQAELDAVLAQEPDKLPPRNGQTLATDFPLSGGAHTDRFLREALLLARLHHPAIPTLYDYFLEDGYWYLVMEYVPGPTLASYIRQYAPLPPLEALNYAMQLCDVLDYLQQQTPPVVFRDLKPSNVILSPEGRLALVDFGIARYFKEGQINDTTDFGSPGYASPEQYEGTGQTDGRSDIYSLGVILHEMLSGKRPARGGTRGSQIEALREINPALSPAICGLVAVATRPEPMYRFQTAHAFYLALERTRAIEERRTYHRHAVLADTGVPGSPTNRRPVLPIPLTPPATPGHDLAGAPDHSRDARGSSRSPARPARTPLPQRSRKTLEQEALAMQLASLEDSLQQRVSEKPLPLLREPGSPKSSANRGETTWGRIGKITTNTSISRRFVQIVLIMLLLFAGALASFFALNYYTRLPKQQAPQQQPTMTQPPTITAQVSWQALPSLPSPQADNTASYIEIQGKGYIYISGGYRGAGASPAYSRGLYRYDIAAARWESITVPGMPTMGNNAAAVDAHQRIFFTGGYSSDTHALASILYLYDPLLNTVQKITPPAQIHLGFGNAMIDDQQGHLYITQGFTTPGNPHALAGTGWYRYDIASGQWEALAALPVGAGYVMLAPDGRGGILMIGGSRDAGQHMPLTQIYRYDTAQNDWSLKPSATPTDLSGAASCLDGQGHLIIIGGYDAQNATVLATTWQLTIATLGWQQLPALPSGGSLLGAAACDGEGHVYLERGANTQESPTADFLELANQA
jgi:serine/threonine protein kinase